MRIVIDTNVLIKTLKRTNLDYFIYEAFENEQFNWIVSNEVLDEYEEKLTDFYSHKTANLVLEILCNANNVVFSEPFYRWNIIVEDPDDNKFSDLALSSNADYLITYDRHFNIFKTLDFPRLQVIKPIEFLDIFRN